ncbi:DNA-3-methyladenine glycosylase family protein [Diaminobutyricibacter sp. McL0608]|uniref:DNA-3-methyladenine glycosylase family protein n=1 Tax=Leifsonia sp. McL0608 TaxID=3143537 RepID=UPI0031F32D34
MVPLAEAPPVAPATPATPAAAPHAPAATAQHPVSTVYRPASPVDLRHTLGTLGRGSYDPTTVWDARGLWRTFRTPDGPVALRLDTASDGIRARAWGAGAEWAIAGVPQLLGCDDDWSALDVSASPLLHESRRRNPGIRLTRTRRVFEALAPAIIEQKVTSVEAYRAWARLVRSYGDVAPGPVPDGMRVSPSPETWRRIPSWEWHRAGVDPRRSRALVQAATVASSLERATASAATLAEAAALLRTVPGVGVWTAAETLQRSHGDPDAVSVGDYHLAHYVGSALIGRRVDDDGMLELLEPWTGQRQRVIRLILASGHRDERHGPRMTIQDHRGH